MASTNENILTQSFSISEMQMCESKHPDTINPSSDSFLVLFLSDYKYDEGSKDGRPGKITIDGDTLKETCDEYKSYDSDSFIGYHTNDAPVRYLLNKSVRDGHPISQIFVIASDKVMTPQRGFSAYNRLKRLVLNEPEFSDVSFTSIPYKMPESEQESRSLPLTIYESFVNAMRRAESSDSTRHMYIDYTGGLRDTNFLLVSLIRYFEINNIECSDIVYGNFQNKQISSLNYIYGMLQITERVNIFLSTGNAKPLYDYYKGPSFLSDDPEVNDFLEAVNEFSGKISLCNIHDIESTSKKLSDACLALENSKKEDISHEMVKLLIPIIKDRFYLDSDVKFPEFYMNLIRWCLKNGLYQQALTLFTDKIPTYLEDTGFFPEGSSPAPAKTLYTSLYELMIYGPELIEFKNVISHFKDEWMSEKYTLKQTLRLLTEYKSVIINKCNYPDDIERGIGQIYDWLNQQDDSEPWKLEFSDGKYQNIDIKEYKGKKKPYIFFNSLLDKSPDRNANKNPKYIFLWYFLYDDFSKFDNIYEHSIFNSSKQRFLELLKQKSSSFTREDKQLLASIDPDSPDRNRYAFKALAVRNIFDVKDHSDYVIFTADGDPIRSPEALADIMAYYLSIKMLRNHINHASELETLPDEREAAKILKPYNSGIDVLDISVDNVDSLLRSAMGSIEKHVKSIPSNKECQTSVRSLGKHIHPKYPTIARDRLDSLFRDLSESDDARKSSPLKVPDNFTSLSHKERFRFIHKVVNDAFVQNDRIGESMTWTEITRYADKHLGQGKIGKNFVYKGLDIAPKNVREDLVHFYPDEFKSNDTTIISLKSKS